MKAYKAFRLLRDLGVLESLQATGIHARELYAVQALLKTSGKPSLAAIAAHDVDQYIESVRGTPAVKVRARRRLLLAIAAAGVPCESLGMPPLVSRFPENFPASIAADLERFRQHLEFQNFGRLTKIVMERNARSIARWLINDCGIADRGLFEPLLDEQLVRKCAEWSARPITRGRARALNTFLWLYVVLEQLWRAAGLDHDETQGKRHALEASFRRDGKSGPPQLLNLRGPDPAPGPINVELRALLDRFGSQVEEARAAGSAGRQKLQETLTVRAIIHTLALTGMRLESLATMRVDRIEADSSGVWSAAVLIKGIPGGPKASTPRWRVGDQWYGQWPLWPSLMPVYEEMFEAFGYDLRDFLKTRRSAAVRWITLDNDIPFGREAPAGSVVAPLWLDWKRGGFLRKSRIGDICRRVVREMLGRPAGRVHIFRRSAALAMLPLYLQNPAASQALLQMSTKMQLHYARTVDLDLPRVFTNFDPFAAKPSLAPKTMSGNDSGMEGNAAAEPTIHSVRSNPLLEGEDHSHEPRRRSRREDRREPTLEDLFGEQSTWRPGGVRSARRSGPLRS